MSEAKSKGGFPPTCSYISFDRALGVTAPCGVAPVQWVVIREGNPTQTQRVCAHHVENYRRLGWLATEYATAPVVNPDPDLAYYPDGSVAGRVIGWHGDVPVLSVSEYKVCSWCETFPCNCIDDDLEGQPEFNGAFDRW